MYNNPYVINGYNSQSNVDRINNQIAELEKMKQQMQQPMTPTNLTQNFQIAPTNHEAIRYANSMEEVTKYMVIGDTPFFSKDMSIVWIKNAKGETKTLSQWSREYNINIVTLSDRLKAGLSIDEALNKPVIKSGGKLLFTINNETKLLSEWCKIYNINYQTAWKKIKNGKSIEKALKLN